jgi:hypothetical protein
LYVATQKANYGKDAVSGILNLHQTLAIDETKSDVTRDFGRVIFSTALVYDWCYDLLSTDDKAKLIAQIEMLGSRMEIEWPKLKQGSVTGHGVEAQIFRDMLSAGVATYDEQPQMYQRAAGRVFAEMYPAARFYHKGSYHHQGSSYGAYRFAWETFSGLIFDRMGYPNVLGSGQSQVPYRWIYLRRPDGQLLRDGDDFNEIYRGFGKYWDMAGTAYIASQYADPVLMGEAVQQNTIGKDALVDFLLFKPLPTSQTGQAATTPTRDSLPLTRYFDSPLGAMIARTGWQDGTKSDAVVAEMKIGSYNFANHQHLDAGGFQLYYKGPLAVQSGIYQGKTGGYGSAHFLNYYQRSIAHNTLLIHDPDEKFTWNKRSITNDGGQQFPNGGKEASTLDDILKLGYQRAQVLARDFGPDAIKPEYSYIKGDITGAYSNKVRGVQRSFVFLNLGATQTQTKVPAALIVLDRITASNAAFKKTWLLHSVEEPVISDNISTVTRTGKGYQSKLVNTTLLPTQDNLSIVKIGGEGREYEVAGVNYPQSILTADNSADGAIWRIEVSPKRAAITDHFLNVLQVMDADNDKKLPVDKVETNEFIGTQIGDRLVLFSKSGEAMSNAFKLIIKSNAALKVLITDMANGEWQVTNTSDKSAPTQTLKSAQNVLYLTLSKGNYLIDKQSP